MSEIDFTKFEDYDKHEEIITLNDPGAGLKGFIAIHRTDNGKAIGGTRIFPYVSEEEAIRDVLRLSSAMTYKCAIAKLPYGGGKAVIIADPEKGKTPGLLRKYAEAVQNMQKSFFTGEDVGLEQKDVDYMLQFSDFFIGKRDVAGDPSNYAALSVFLCIKTALKFKFGTDSLEGRIIAIKGLGKTGTELARLCLESGAKIYGAEVNITALARAKELLPQIEILEVKEIHTIKCDVYAPCALGDEFTHRTVDLLKAKIICGTANNQLENEEIGDILFKKEIIYVPDYLANAGGLINVADELEEGGYSKERVLERIGNLKNTLQLVLDQSMKDQVATNRIADKLSESFIIQKNI